MDSMKMRIKYYRTSRSADPILGHYSYDDKSGLYWCQKCSYRSENGCYIRQHMVSHSTHRPYRCHYYGCDLSYKRPQELKRHVLITHLNKRPYKCQTIGCEKAFTQLQTLKDHIRSVHSNVRYKCRFIGCNKMFSLLKYLQSHQRRRHHQSMGANTLSGNGVNGVDTDLNNCQIIHLNDRQMADIRAKSYDKQVVKAMSNVGTSSSTVGQYMDCDDRRTTRSMLASKGQTFGQRIEDKPKRQSNRRKLCSNETNDSFTYECNWNPCTYSTDSFEAIANHFEDHWFQCNPF